MNATVIAGEHRFIGRTVVLRVKGDRVLIRVVVFNVDTLCKPPM